MAMMPPKLFLPLAVGLAAIAVVLLTNKGGETVPSGSMSQQVQAVQVAQQFGVPPLAQSGEAVQIGVPGADPLAEPSPPNYIPRNLKLFEGHWQGMDGRLMTDELARKLRFPRGLQGILLGEVTLNAARSGLLGGDVVIKVDGVPVPTIEEWQRVSREAANRTESLLTILRKEGGRNSLVMRTLNLVLRAEDTLGFVQVEAAPMILPGDPRPHVDRGPCTNCHPIGKGLELTPDPDLISLPPPVISQRQVAKVGSPHENRGPCEACHVIQ